MVPVLGWLGADGAVVVGDEVGRVEHVGGSEGERKYSGEVIEKVVARLCKFWGEMCISFFCDGLVGLPM